MDEVLSKWTECRKAAINSGIHRFGKEQEQPACPTNRSTVLLGALKGTYSLVLSNVRTVIYTVHLH